MGRAAQQDYKQYLWPPFTQVGSLSDGEPLIIAGGKGSTVVDTGGREYIDAHGGLWVSNVGYGRGEMVEAIASQARQLAWFPSFDCMSNDVAVTLARRLVKMAEPEGMSKAFFSSGGSEAIETAIKIARQFWSLKGYPERHKIIARKRSYHGVTMGALSATATDCRRHFGPLVPGFLHVEPPYCYRCPFELAHPGCGLVCAEDLERTIGSEGPETVAAFIAEPVMGAGGLIFPPEGYWQLVQDICRRHGILLVVDEVMTGFGRTGAMFASRHWGVRPDIMVLAKALTSGYQPLAATLVNGDIPDVYMGSLGDDRHLKHGNTYSGHPIACAAALTNLDITEAEDLPGRSAELGHHLLSRLRELEGLPRVGDIHGMGLLARVELVECGTTKKPFDPSRFVGWMVGREMQKRGVIMRPLGDVLTFSPPLVITRGEIDAIVDALGDVLESDVGAPA